jgi:hypothetical protein
MSKNTQIGELINYISVNESGDVVLSNGHLVATQNYVSTAVANLVDAAPATLDTLNELAAALGDDPNFATTVTNSIGGKLSLTGGTLTGALNGTSATFTGAVTSQQSNISADGAGVVLQGYVDNNLRIAVRGSGYNDGGRGSLIAQSGDFAGTLSVTGAATFSSTVAATQFNSISSSASLPGFGVSSGNGMYNAGTNVLAFSTASTERMRITSNGNIGFGVTPAAWGVGANYTGYQFKNASLYVRTSSPELYVNNNAYYNGTNWKYLIGAPAAKFELINNEFLFSSVVSGTADANITWVDRMRITSGGNVLIGTTSDNGNKLQVSGGASFSNAISPNGGVFALGDVLTTTGRLLVSNGSQGANTETASLLLGNRGYFSTSDIGAARISAVSTGANWYNGTALAFYTNPGPDVTSTGATERMRIASNGSVKIRSNSSSIFTTSKYYSVNNNSTSDIFFDINSEFGIGNGGYVLVEITLSAYGNAGSGGGVYKWIAGGYSGHTIALTGYHKYEVIANTIGGNVSSISPYNPTYNVYGVTIVNSAAYVVVGVMEIRVTTTY